MTNDVPLVSVLMTAYNREKYIGEAIESVLASSYKNFELIVVDDCSTDNTEAIVKAYLEMDTRVHSYRNDENLGDYSNRNKAASYAKGKYIKYLDSDDIIYPHGLGVMVECMERYPEAGFGLSEVAFRDRRQPVLLKPGEAYRINYFEKELFGRSPGSSIIRADAFRVIGGFTGIDQVGDHEMWHMLANEYSMVTMPTDIVWCRVHSEQEQSYDNFTDKAEMHFAVQLSALESPDCPLHSDEVVRAIKILRRKQSSIFLSYLLRRDSFKDAMRFRKSLSLSWTNIVMSSWQRFFG